MAWYDFDFDFGGNSGGGKEPTTGNQYGSLGSGFYDLPAWTPASQSSGSQTGGWDLGSLFDTLKSGYKAFNDAGGSTLVKAGLGAYDAYNKNKMAKNLMPQIEALNNAYAPGSPEAEQMRKQIEARDAAAGRRSQYGTREVELASELNKQRSNIRTSPGYLNLYGAMGGQKQGAYKGLADLFGQVSKTNFADGGLVGAGGDESDIQWKGTESGFNARDLSFLSNPEWQSATMAREFDTPLISKSWAFDDGPKQAKTPKLPTDDWDGELTEDQVSQLNPYSGTDSTGLGQTLSGQGDKTLADFWQQGTQQFDANALGQEGTTKMWNQGFNDLAQSVLDKNPSFDDYRKGANNPAVRAYEEASKSLYDYLNTRPSYVSAPSGYKGVDFSSGGLGLTLRDMLRAAGGYGAIGGTGGGSAAAGAPIGGGSGLTFGGFGGGGSGGYSGPTGSFGSFADGGKIPGRDPHSSDDVPINVSRGEFVIPVDVVDAIGADKLQSLVDMFHKPTGRR